MQPDLMRLIELNAKGYHCSEIIMSLAMELAGEEDNPALIRAMSALSGGLGFTQGVCGTLTAGCAAIGLFAGVNGDASVRDPDLNPMISEYCAWFDGSTGQKTQCRDIIGTKGPMCSTLVTEAFQEITRILDENGRLNGH